MGQRSASKPIGVIRDYSPGGLLGGDIYVPPAGLFGAAPSFGSLTPTEPSYRDTVTDTLRGGLEALGMGRQGAVQNAKGLVGLGEWTPWGALTAADDIKRSYNKGDYLGTGLGLAMFLGPGAKTAKKPMLDLAEEMLAKGATRDEIWNATGWFKGADKKWRFEADDSGAVTRGYGPMTDIVAKRGGTAKDVLRHPELWDAYPELGDVSVQPFVGPEGSRGTFQPADVLDESSRGILGLNNGLRGSQMGSTMLHELQHGVQTMEGFARGAHPDEYASGAMFHQNARSLQSALSKELTGGLTAKPHEIAEWIKYGDPNRIASIVKEHGFASPDEALAFLKQQDEMRTPMSQYKRTAGEVEARNVQKRMNMTADQRKATPPWLTEDVPLDQQIVRFR